MDRADFSKLLMSLNKRRETDIELWGLLAKVMVNLMNTKSLGVIDLMQVTRALVDATVRSEKLYGFIVKYFMTIGFTEKNWGTSKVNVPIFFFFSLAKANANLGSENAEFFDLTNSYLRSQIDRLDEKHCEICLDIWKLNQNFVNEETKILLIERKSTFNSGITEME